MYKYVFFDCDGTILNTLSDITDSANYSLDKFSFPKRTENETRLFLGKGAEHLIRCCAPDNTSDEIIAKMLEIYMPYYQQHCKVKTAPYDGVVPLMENLKKKDIKLAVVSNKQDDAVKELCREHFAGLIDVAIGEKPDLKKKPFPDMVLAAANMLGADISQSVYVGDTEIDIMTGKNSNMDCIAVSWGFRTREEILTKFSNQLIVDNVSELLNEIVR